MKKCFLCVFIVCCMVLVPMFANAQKYYSISSQEWQLVNQLCHYAGVAGPSSNGPVTQAQLELALERAERYMSQDDELLVFVKEKLADKGFVYKDDFGSVSVAGTLSPEVYFQTGFPYGLNGDEKPEYAIDQDWFIKGQKDRRPASIVLENTIGGFFYGRMVLDYKQKASYIGEKKSYWNDSVHFSFFGASSHQNFPFDAGISLGTKGFSFILGRGNVSLGEGYTGNTAIGDNYEYQEFMKLGFYTKRTSVFLTLTNFDSSRDTFEGKLVYYESGEGPRYKLVYEPVGRVIDKPWKLNATGFSDYRELRHSVTYEVVPMDPFKMSLSFITLIDTNTAFDFRYLNPFMVMHNYYNYHEETTLEANNMISVDVSWSFLKKWSLYAQVTMDQFQIPGEAEGYLGFGYTEPNAFGGLLNISYTDILAGGLFNVYAETVYNMPGMYLNSKFYDENGNITQYNHNRDTGVPYARRCWSQDFLLGYSRTESNDPDLAYSGYKYGPDCFVVSIGGVYEKPLEFSVKSALMYMMHGEKGRGVNVSNYTFDGIDGIGDVNRIELTGVVEHTLCVSIEGACHILPWLSVSGGAAYSYRRNFRNEDGRTFGNLQAYIGVSIGNGR